MGLGDHVVGVTSQCILPQGVERPRVGDAFSANVTEAILSVKPDLVLVQVNPDKFKTLREVDPNVKVEHFTIERLADIPTAMTRIAALAGKPDAAKTAVGQFEAELVAVDKRVAGVARPRVLFVMGFKQPSTGGGDTFLGDMIERAGGTNVARDMAGWKGLNIESVLSLKPDIIVCWIDSAYDKADEARDYWMKLKDLPAAQSGRVVVVDDRYWTIPTRRTSQYVAKLADIVHPRPAATEARP